MNILPRTNADFTKKDYWDSFFVKRGKEAFEWYGEYRELCVILQKYMKPTDSVLVVGCGNSNLSIDLYDAGYKNMMNIDISNVAIKQMQRKCKKRNGLEFKQMDVQKMDFEDGKYNVVLDKGTLDALMPKSSTESSKDTVIKMFKEINRVLKVGGRYVCISLLQKHVLAFLLEQLPSLGFLIRICQCHDTEPLEHNMPVFIVVCTKLKVMPNFKPVFEVVLASDIVQRLASQEEMVDAISMTQQAAMLCSGLNRQNISESGEVSIDLALPDNPIPRYTIVVCDKKCSKPAERMTYAAFIVPQGREREWIFGSKEGRQFLVESSGMDRLAVILLHRGHEYATLQTVQDETCVAVKSMAPANIIQQKQKIAFLSVGADLGNRQEVVRGKSDMSGEYVVEDAEGEGGTVYRRLIFLETQNVVQSEARLLPSDDGSTVVDVEYLSCQHHVFMSVGVAIATLLNTKLDVRILVIGLGGGGLCMFIRKYFPKVHITVVDIDPEVKKIALNYFGLKEDDRLNIVIADGIDYIRNNANSGETFEAVLFDVDSKDPSQGLSCPPEIFLTPETINNTAKCVSQQGIFILNFVCRLDSLRKVIRDMLKNIYSNLSVIKLKEEVNEIIFCQKQQQAVGLEKAASHFNDILKQGGSNSSENVVDLDELAELMVKLD